MGVLGVKLAAKQAQKATFWVRRESVAAAPTQNGLRKQLFGTGVTKKQHKTKEKDPKSRVWGRRDRAAGTYSAPLDIFCLFFKGFCALFGVFGVFFF